MRQEINVGDAVYLQNDSWAPVRCHAIGISGDLLEVQVYESQRSTGFIFKSSVNNFVHEDDFFKAHAVRGLVGDPSEWSVRSLLALYYDVMSYAPVSHLFWGEFSEMSEGELKTVVKVLEKTSARLVRTS